MAACRTTHGALPRVYKDKETIICIITSDNIINSSSKKRVICVMRKY